MLKFFLILRKIIAHVVSNDVVLRSIITIKLIGEAPKKTIPIGVHFVDGVSLIEEGVAEVGLVVIVVGRRPLLVITTGTKPVIPISTLVGIIIAGRGLRFLTLGFLWNAASTLLLCHCLPKRGGRVGRQVCTYEE